MTAPNTHLKKAMVFITDHSSEPITVSMIADSMGVSVGMCIRVFRNTLHTTPYQYLRKYRLMLAAEALAKKDGRSVVEIAEAYCFADRGYFNRIFKDEYGMTPTEYRKRMIVK